MSTNVAQVILLWFSGQRDEADAIIGKLSLEELVTLCGWIDHAEAWDTTR